MSFSTRIELHCDKPGCTHKPLVAEGPEAKRFDLFTEAKKAGWQWKSAEQVYCPEHREAPARSAKPATKGNGKASKGTKGAGKKASSKGKASAGKPVGQSIGKVAKSAKQAAA